MTRIDSDWDREERAALAGLESEVAALGARVAGGPPIELLRAARAGVLPDALQARVSAHLAQSGISRALADDLEALTPGPTAEDAERMLARVRAGARSEGPSAVRPAFTWQPALLFVSLATAVVLFAISPVWRAPSPVPAVRPAAAPAPSPTPPALVLALSKPELRLSLAALQFRGSPLGNPLLADLKPAFAAFDRDDFADAAQQLGLLAPRYPQSVEVPFYLGVSRLFLDDAAGARDALGAAERLADNGFADDVAWYLAIADERSGDRAGARARMDRLCRATGVRADEACAASARLR